MRTRWFYVVASLVAATACSSPSGSIHQAAPPKSTTTLAASGTTTAETDAKRCAVALPRLVDYHASEVVRSEGGQSDEVRAWLANRLESMGTTPDRGIEAVPSDQRIVVCVVRGVFPIPQPLLAPGEEPPGFPDGGRFIVPPDGRPVLDGAGPLDRLLPLTPEFAS